MIATVGRKRVSAQFVPMPSKWPNPVHTALLCSARSFTADHGGCPWHGVWVRRPRQGGATAGGEADLPSDFGIGREPEVEAGTGEEAVGTGPGAGGTCGIFAAEAGGRWWSMTGTAVVFAGTSCRRHGAGAVRGMIR